MDVKYIAIGLLIISAILLSISIYHHYRSNPYIPYNPPANNTSTPTPTTPSHPTPTPTSTPAVPGTLKYTSTTFTSNEGHQI